ncbi:MAG: hypothetical protein K0U69_12470 [Actinomycetia bacterium]|nr:hypothetical protein [Actinomycetes bacterium]
MDPGYLRDAEPASEDPDTDRVGQPDPAAGAGDDGNQASQYANPSPEPVSTATQPITYAAEGTELSAEPDTAVEQETATAAAVSGSAIKILAPEPTPPEPTPVTERLSISSAAKAPAPAAAAAAPTHTFLGILGAVVFNLYSVAIRVVGGPPLLPRGSAVTVQSSTLEVDCGDGYEVPADWYVPAGPTPTQLIYLQHGFMAAGPFYSYTAARLAEATNSIVVATSLTSNFLACDGCWVGGSPMHKAVADLFVDGDTALADSATAAGYGPSLVEGVHRVVLAGHSAGGGLAAGAAGYMAGAGTIDRLAGVVMLDGVGFGSVMPDALAKLPDELPIYNLAGKAYFWNMNGSAGLALEEEWPGKFSGVRLVGGLHSDTMLGGNPLIQAGLNLVTGWSKVENVKAAEMLSAAWINDMFAGNSTSPYYGAPGTVLEIETSRGTAEAYVMPGPPERLNVIDVAFQFVADLLFSLDFAACAVPGSEGAYRRPNSVIEFPTPNTALSLDGGTKPGQSIGQQCMQGRE